MNLTLLCFELKMAFICGAADSVYYSGYDQYFHIDMYITTEQLVFLAVNYRYESRRASCRRSFAMRVF